MSSTKSGLPHAANPGAANTGAANPRTANTGAAASGAASLAVPPVGATEPGASIAGGPSNAAASSGAPPAGAANAGASAPATASAAVALNLASVSLRAFEIFVSVVESGGMTAAAESLGITQSAVSQAIRGFEDAIGHKLFDRAVRPPVLTFSGTTVLEHARAILERMRLLERAIHTVDHAQLPLLRMGMANTFAVTAGPSLIERIRHLARSWSIQTGAAQTRIDGLLERQVDFVITFDEHPPLPDLLTLPLYSEPYFIALPISFTAQVESLESLASQLEMLHYGGHLHLSRQIENYLRSEGLTMPMRYRFDTIDSVIAMVAAGLGWALVTPLALLRSASLAERIVCLPLPGRPLERRLALTGRRNEGEPIAAAISGAAIDALRRDCLPRIHALMPGISDQVKILGEGLKAGVGAAEQGTPAAQSKP